MVRTGGAYAINAGDGSDLGLYDYFPDDPTPIGLIGTLEYIFALFGLGLAGLGWSKRK
jgi:hypothetical protein